MKSNYELWKWALFAPYQQTSDAKLIAWLCVLNVVAVLSLVCFAIFSV